MTDSVILHAFSPNTPSVRQRATWVMLELVRRHGMQIVVDWPCDSEGDYLRGIQSCWHMGSTLVLLEHDIEVTLWDFLSLQDCPHPICVQAYQLHSATPGIPASVWAWRNGGQWGKESDQFAEQFSFGCTAFKRSALELSEPSQWPADSWFNLDHGASLVYAARGMRAHIHWPAAIHRHH
jgi:hypothetical protein